MDVRDAVASLYSCRAFLPTPIPIETIKGILNGAARAPSGGTFSLGSYTCLRAHGLRR